jgi:hypothetical protein
MRRKNGHAGKCGDLAWLVLAVFALQDWKKEPLAPFLAIVGREKVRTGAHFLAV